MHSSQFTAAQPARGRQPAVQAQVKAPAIAPCPHPATRRLEWSTYRAQDATPAELWDICTEHVDNPVIGQMSKARGTCPAGVLMEQGLAFDADGKPHPRHANVIDWPPAKHELKNLQQKLAPQVVLEIRPSHIPPPEGGQ